MHFIAFEGLDGAGKSTLIGKLDAYLRSVGQSTLISREPGGTPLGNEIRRLLIQKGDSHPRARAETLLYQADRAQHVDTVIRPALKSGKWVLSDRFAASSVAFQSGGREISPAEISWLNRFSTGGLLPDLYVLLDLTVEESKQRMQARGEDLDRFEIEAKEFHMRVRDSYLQQAEADSVRWLILDAGQRPDQLMQRLLEDLRGRKWLS